MERKKAISYQLELFDINGQGVIYPYPNHRDVEETDGQTGFQTVPAGKQGRALVCGLMEQACSPTNLRKAYKRVKQNKGSCGMDGMQVDELGEWIKRHGTDLVEQLKTGTCQPQAVRLVEIPKPDGGTRRLGIPTVIDRVIHQAINRVLIPIYESEFSDSSYGFRPRRSTHQALQKASRYVEEGRTTVINIDLKNFFDVVNHDRLMYRLSTKLSFLVPLRLFVTQTNYVLNVLDRIRSLLKNKGFNTENAALALSYFTETGDCNTEAIKDKVSACFNDYPSFSLYACREATISCMFSTAQVTRLSRCCMNECPFGVRKYSTHGGISG